jgi:hypothetical protein
MMDFEKAINSNEQSILSFSGAPQTRIFSLVSVRMLVPASCGLRFRWRVGALCQGMACSSLRHRVILSKSSAKRFKSGLDLRSLFY